MARCVSCGWSRVSLSLSVHFFFLCAWGRLYHVGMCVFEIMAAAWQGQFGSVYSIRDWNLLIFGNWWATVFGCGHCNWYLFVKN